MRDQTRANLTRELKVEQNFPAISQSQNQASAKTFSEKYIILLKLF